MHVLDLLSSDIQLIYSCFQIQCQFVTFRAKHFQFLLIIINLLWTSPYEHPSP